MNQISQVRFDNGRFYVEKDLTQDFYYQATSEEFMEKCGCGSNFMTEFNTLPMPMSMPMSIDDFQQFANDNGCGIDFASIWG